MNASGNIKYYRNEAKLTQKDLAEKSGISLRALSNYENGTRTPSMEVIIKIAGALGVDPLDIVEEETKDMRELIEEFRDKVVEEAFNTVYDTAPGFTKVGFDEKCKTPHDFWQEVVFHYPHKFCDLTVLDDKGFDEAIEEIANFLEIAYKLKVEEIFKRKNK